MEIGTSLEQFRACLRSDQARGRLGLTLSAEDAIWVAEDPTRSADYYARWVSAREAEKSAPAAVVDASSEAEHEVVFQPVYVPTPVALPGRQSVPVSGAQVRSTTTPPQTSIGHRSTPTDASEVAGIPTRGFGSGVLPFVLSLIAICFTTTPFIVLPLGLIGVVLALRLLLKSPLGYRGRGLAIAGLVIGVVAIGIDLAIMAIVLAAEFG
ncbi:hypothetical protein F1C58_16710 (plasmid) [Glaciihabitans sp. INWT7]|uniref:DUF4190 domain-containing protein n=1 Tax=Glaciihabitans sp. INWT7 TaxID=2596912 RepID=UPI0016264781|nr:DUF4190 domain-containing protein [Glaciihabitans sp. INWT7]QNE48699.1 hypothetical protein F1C58_16710 [Glaciihabitans sp. INWT7]